MDDDEVLSADLLLTPEEIYAEFRERCEEAANNFKLTTRELEAAVKVLCRTLERSAR